jgi:hypothetical protein
MRGIVPRLPQYVFMAWYLDKYRNMRCGLAEFMFLNSLLSRFKNCKSMHKVGYRQKARIYSILNINLCNKCMVDFSR